MRDGDSAFAWRVKDGKLQKVTLTLGDRDPRTRRRTCCERPRRGRQGAALSEPTLKDGQAVQTGAAARKPATVARAK